MKRGSLILVLAFNFILLQQLPGQAIMSGGQPATLEIRLAGENSVRVTLLPASLNGSIPVTPLLAEGRVYPEPIIRISEKGSPASVISGKLKIDVSFSPLTVSVSEKEGRLIQKLEFMEDGSVTFVLDGEPVLGMGEGGPRMTGNWREQPIEFNRMGRYHDMVPRWQANAYGSRNPVASLVGTSGWGLYVAAPWVEVDLRRGAKGRFVAWVPPAERSDSIDGPVTRNMQGRPPIESILPGYYDIFVFNARNPVGYMKEWSEVTGTAVMPPKWSLGYMQSHRTLEDETQMINIVKTFRDKKIPVDAVIYLGTGFCPRGWNTEQPSFDFNPEVFKREPAAVVGDLHNLNVKVINHIVPWRRDKLPTITGNIPPASGEVVDKSHMLDYWLQHEDLVKAGVDAWWPDEGDWFNLFERVNRHKLYYVGPLHTTPDVRPWSLHRNGHAGIAQWGGWVWSGDTDSAWKTLEGQISVGINHSLSLSPFWGSDIGGFYPNEELTGELFARWFQFGAFCPSFRSHGRTWWTRLPWGWGLSELGPRENRANPLLTELNNPAIEPICRDYAELRYRLMPYTYTLAWEARTTGLPMMRAMWLHYSTDIKTRSIGDQYLWGRDMIIAPVYIKGATSRDVYLPEGMWYDWWTGSSVRGGTIVTRQVDLNTMPIYVRAGSIIPMDPVKQYTGEVVNEPMTIRIFTGAAGDYTMYEDDGISLGYLKGEYSQIRFTWDDGRRILTIARKDSSVTGSGPVELEIELIPSGRRKRVTWDGNPITIPV
ncbi:MAG: glycoside hydrolase family 31 protein [Bacteroidales bacterium]|nr:glycoside hydrolase family 31 protein [Bacteroidales bacterium]